MKNMKASSEIRAEIKDSKINFQQYYKNALKAAKITRWERTL